MMPKTVKALAHSSLRKKPGDAAMKFFPLNWALKLLNFQLNKNYGK